MSTNSIDRRGAMGFLAAGAAAAALPFKPAWAQGLRRREDYRVSSAFNRTAFRSAVQAMKDRSAVSKDDPKGWYYWSAVHGTVDAVPPALRNVYNQCKHNSPYFYPWHRAFLYYFEEVMRELNGFEHFSLPYWNWYSQATIPKDFTWPADATNVLWHPRESDTVAGLSQQFLGLSDFYQASHSMEIDPHGAVHDQIGDDMGVVPRSARDPIFWLHHCNVDRLWTVWNNRGYSNPPPSDPWSNERFAYDVGGTMTKTAGQVTTTTALGYTYDQEHNPVTSKFLWNIALAAVLAGKVPSAAEAAAAKNGAKVASVLGTGFGLGAKSSRIDFALSADDRGKVLSFASGQPPGGMRDVELVLDGVAIAPAGKRGGYSFRICVGVPGGKTDAAELDARCVGNIGLFQLSVLAEHQGHMGGTDTGSYTMRFPLGPALKAAGVKALSGGIPVTFVAEHATLKTGKGTNTYVTVKDARLEFVGP